MPGNLALEWYPSERLAWRPPEKLTIAQWSERNVVLTVGEEKGPLRWIRAPFLRPVLDATLDPHVEAIVFCKSAQIGGTLGMICILAYFMEQEPCPAMLVLADERTAGFVSRRKIQRIFRASPRLSDIIIESRFNAMDMTFMGGGYLELAWASSVAGLGTREVRIMVFDEVDKKGYYMTSNEADPLSLGAERTETFANSKQLILSTPTIDTGNIAKELDSCDIVYDWHVPCPYCGVMQPLRWSREYSWGFDGGVYRAGDGEMRDLGQVVWEGGRDATETQIKQAGYECGSCGKLWTTIEKNNAVELGRMVPRTAIKDPPRKVGYHVNRLYSLLGKSGDIPRMVRKFIKSLHEPKKLQGFVNSTLAEPWKQIITTTSEKEVLDARVELPPQTVPQEAVLLTAAVDVQKYGFYFGVRAWARDYTSWLIHYGSLPSWDDVDGLLFDTLYPYHEQEEDKFIRVSRAVIDTGGGLQGQDIGLTEQTYWFVRQNMRRGVQLWATKGSSRPLATKLYVGKPIDKTPSGKPIPGGLSIMSLDTHQLKDLYHYRLERARDGEPGGAYLHQEVQVDYAKQILAEEKRLNNKGLEEWVRTRKDNHYLDIEAMIQVTADPEWPRGGVHLIGATKRKPQRDKPKGQGFIRGGRAGGWIGR